MYIIKDTLYLIIPCLWYVGSPVHPLNIHPQTLTRLLKNGDKEVSIMYNLL
jgi:hypothetical protein